MTSYKFQWAISIASNNKRRPPLLIPEYYNLYNIIGQEQAQHRNPAFLRKLTMARTKCFIRSNAEARDHGGVGFVEFLHVSLFLQHRPNLARFTRIPRYFLCICQVSKHHHL